MDQNQIERALTELDVEEASFLSSIRQRRASLLALLITASPRVLRWSMEADFVGGGGYTDAAVSVSGGHGVDFDDGDLKTTEFWSLCAPDSVGPQPWPGKTPCRFSKEEYTDLLALPSEWLAYVRLMGGLKSSHADDVVDLVCASYAEALAVRLRACPDAPKEGVARVLINQPPRRSITVLVQEFVAELLEVLPPVTPEELGPLFAPLRAKFQYAQGHEVGRVVGALDPTNGQTLVWSGEARSVAGSGKPLFPRLVVANATEAKKIASGGEVEEWVGGARIQRSEYRKNGKWSYRTADMLLAPGLTAYRVHGRTWARWDGTTWRSCGVLSEGHTIQDADRLGIPAYVYQACYQSESS